MSAAFAYNPDQSRASDGKFGEGGGAAKAAPAKYTPSPAGKAFAGVIVHGISDKNILLKSGMRDMAPFHAAFDAAKAKGISPTQLASSGDYFGDGKVRPVEVRVDPKGQAFITDGRHRFSAARDAGAEKILVHVTQEGARGGTVNQRTAVVPIAKSIKKTSRGEIDAGYNPDQSRAADGKFGDGGGSGGGAKPPAKPAHAAPVAGPHILPKADTHADAMGPPQNKNDSQDPRVQVGWAAQKAWETKSPVYMQPNPKHVPGNPGTGGPYKLTYKAPAKGDFHVVHPDGSIKYHAGTSKGQTVHSREDFALLARAIEASVDGEPPEAARLWRAGWNKTDKGDLQFTPRSAKLVQEAYAERGNPLAFYYEHEDRLPLDKRGGSPMRGACAAPSSMLVVRDVGEGPECWAESIAWTDEAKRQIKSGERRQISPIAKFDSETREIVEILNVSLCAEGATHHGTILASAGKATSGMDDMIQQVLDALNAGDFEAAETLIQQMEAQGAAGPAQMARMAMAKTKPAAGPPAAGPPPGAGPPAPEDVATKRLAAATRYEQESFARMGALDAAIAEAKAAAKQSRKATVHQLIAANRDMFDAVDEREHLGGCDPSATERHIASLTRKRTGGGILEAAKPGSGAKLPAREKPTETLEATPELNPKELDMIAEFNRGKDAKFHITAAEFQDRKNSARGVA